MGAMKGSLVYKQTPFLFFFPGLWNFVNFFQNPKAPKILTFGCKFPGGGKARTPKAFLPPAADNFYMQFLSSLREVFFFSFNSQYQIQRDLIRHLEKKRGTKRLRKRPSAFVVCGARCVQGMCSHRRFQAAGATI